VVRIWRLPPVSGLDDGQDCRAGVRGQRVPGPRSRDPAITLTAPLSDARARGSDLAGCTPGLGWGDWGVRSACCQFAVANPPDRMARSQWSSLNVVFSRNAAGHLLRNWTSGGRYHQTTHGQGLRVF
jgi:hypothetical protein